MEFLTTAHKISTGGKKDNEPKFKINNGILERKSTNLGFLKLKSNLGDSNLGNIAQSLIDYKRLTDPKTKRNFFLFIDCNLRE